MMSIDNILILTVTFLSSLIVCLALMPSFIHIMERFRILDKPGGRKIHSSYTAHMGGVVIAIGFAVGLTAMMFAYREDVSMKRALFFGIIMLIMLAVGIRDDMNNLSPLSKLLFEIGVGFGMAFMGLKITHFTGICYDQIIEIPEWLSYVLTIFFFIVICNAYNLIDGIDGQAGMQAVNVFLFMLAFYIIYVGGVDNFELLTPMFMMMCCCALLGAVLGFLKFNWQKARVFMGDTGSLFIGTMITIVMIMSIKYAYTTTFQGHSESGFVLKAVFVPFVCIFYIPLADSLRVFVGRVARHKNPLSPDKTHIHHILLHKGYSHQRITLTIFLCSFIIALVFWFLAFFITDLQMTIIVVASWFLYVWILYRQSKKIQHKSFSNK